MFSEPPLNGLRYKEGVFNNKLLPTYRSPITLMFKIIYVFYGTYSSFCKELLQIFLGLFLGSVYLAPHKTSGSTSYPSTLPIDNGLIFVSIL